MPYALSNLRDGQPPGARAIRVASEADAAAGEVVVDDIPPGYLWDATLQQLRAPNAADLLAQAKRSKRQELLLAFKADYALVWIIDDIEVEEQKDAILAKAAANRTANETALVNRAGTLITKIKTKFADINAATTEAQVQAITW